MPICLKLSPDVLGLQKEARALKAFQKRGGIDLLGEEAGMLLMERAIPGVSLKTYFPEQEEESIKIASSVIKKLKGISLFQNGMKFPHISDWLKALDEEDTTLSETILKQARCLRDTLLKTASPSILLHGDLHHENILKKGDDWVVIDPKGVWGEPLYEVGAFIRNPMPILLQEKNVGALLQKRIKIFAHAFHAPEKRLIEWSYVSAVLGWMWALEDQLDESYFKELTLIFQKLL